MRKRNFLQHRNWNLIKFAKTRPSDLWLCIDNCPSLHAVIRRIQHPLYNRCFVPVHTITIEFEDCTVVFLNPDDKKLQDYSMLVVTDSFICYGEIQKYLKVVQLYITHG